MQRHKCEKCGCEFRKEVGALAKCTICGFVNEVKKLPKKTVPTYNPYDPWHSAQDWSDYD